MLAYFRRLVNPVKQIWFDLADILEGNMTKFYLIIANISMVCFAIWFSNAGLLPFKNVGDFAFFAVLTLILGLYRSGWTFVFFVGALALENVNLMPTRFGIAIRPYQFFGFVTIVALLMQLVFKRLPFSLPKFKWPDLLAVIFALAGFFSSLASANKTLSLKQAVIALSFVLLYFLTRIFVQSFDDLKRIAPFFLSSGFVVAVYAIWQNVAFLRGLNSFEIMPGRPNGTFAEADWLGIYVTFLLAALFSILYISHKKSVNNGTAPISNKFFNDLIFKQIGIYFLLIISFVVLILTVSRSAWIGAIFVVLAFLKFVSLSWWHETDFGNKNLGQKFLLILNLGRWQWKKAGIQLFLILISLGVAALIAMPLTRFGIAGRAVSTGGMQKITVSCEAGKSAPEKIANVDELSAFGCRHINLEEIDLEKSAGKTVLEISRNDPNVGIRGEIYKKSSNEIKKHPIFGLGWGQISSVLGKDGRGAGLNASNIFLEVWLGSGLLGILSFACLLGYLVVASVAAFMKKTDMDENAIIFLALGWVAIVFPNLFNSGIFLGFVWAYLGVAVSLLSKND